MVYSGQLEASSVNISICLNTINSVSKTITIRNEVYEELKKIMRKDESFSELLERLSREKRPIDALSKMRGSVEFRKKKTMLEEMEDRRSEKRL